MQLIQTLFIVVHLLREVPWLQLWDDLQFDAHTILDSIFNPIQIPPSSYSDSLLSLGQLIEHHGFKFEEHHILTDDGYILTAHRIPCVAQNCEMHNLGQPVIIQHGLMDNSGTWVINNQEYNLPYLLALQGYDVWMTNSRGSVHSLGHTDPQFNWHNTFSEYWDFTYDEMAQFDLPANLNYITETSGYRKVVYIGHSQGTTQFWAAGSNDPEFLNSKVQAFVGLGPVMYVEHERSPLVMALHASRIFEVLYSLGVGNFMVSQGPLLNLGISKFCYHAPAVCWTVISQLTGRNMNGIPIDLTRLNVMGANEPGGTSLKNLVKWMQGMSTSRFQKFDHGEEENIRRYGTSRPPRYRVENLRKLNFPMQLHFGSQDYLIGKEDARRLVALIEHNQPNPEIYWQQDYAHLDYVWSLKAKDDIYKRLIEFIEPVSVEEV